MAEQPPIRTQAAKGRKITRLPRYYWPFSTVLLALSFLAFGVAIISLVCFSIVLPYTFTNATYQGQMIVRSNTGRHELKVGVRFGTGDHGIVTAYIYPGSNHLQHKGPVPIFYEDSDPQNVFYATPSDRAATPIWLSVGGAMLLAGFSFFASAIRWRRRIAIASQAEKWQSVYLYHWENLQMVTVFQEGGPKYTWGVFRRTLPSKESQTSPDVSDTTQTQQVGRRSTLARILSRFFYSIKTPAVTWPTPSLAEISGDLGPYRWLVIRSSGELLVPDSRATPVIGTGHAATAQLIVDDALLSAHRRLLAAYATVRNQARLLPRFGSYSA